MDGLNNSKKYEAFKIPGQQQFKVDGAAIELPQIKSSEPVTKDEGLYYEIEYDSCPFPGVGKYVLKSQKIHAPNKDEKRELFGQMREIARTHPSIYDSSRFFDYRVQQNNGMIFYKQGIFMKDFTDDYAGNRPFSVYFPSYQMMGYEQLRTYFTWRTEVRKGNVADISLSYGFLYIYELLANIGVRDPEDGLNQLMSFWMAFSAYNKSMDKYVLRWLKDYHIYYELPHSFKEFIDANNLTKHYPNMVDTDDSFDLLCSLSRYDVRKSIFFTDDNVNLIKDCFRFVIDELRLVFEDNGIDYDESIFQPTKKMSPWKPFKDALFYPWLKQSNRRVVLSGKEMYICDNNKWYFNTTITSANSRQLIGYIMKQMEVALRKVTKYKYKLSADINTISHEAVIKLSKAGLSLEAIINDSVERFYKEETKTVVIVDQEALTRIRQEVLITQEKLYVPEQDKPYIPIASVQNDTYATDEPEQDNAYDPYIPVQEEKSYVPVAPIHETPHVPIISVQQTLDFTNTFFPDSTYSSPDDSHMTPILDVWDNLKNSLTQVETEALSVVLLGELDLKKYADQCGIMLEVLVDGINEKAMDLIGDNLLDDEFVLYDDYKEEVKELIR